MATASDADLLVQCPDGVEGALDLGYEVSDEVPNLCLDNRDVLAGHVLLERQPRCDRKALSKARGRAALALRIEGEVVRVAKLELGVSEPPGLEQFPSSQIDREACDLEIAVRSQGLPHGFVGGQGIG